MENKGKRKLPGWAKVSIVLLSIAVLFTILGLPAYVAFGLTGLLGVLILILMSIILAIRKRKFLGSTLASFVFIAIAFTAIGSTPSNDKSNLDEPTQQPEVVEALANDEVPIPEESTDKNDPDNPPASEKSTDEKTPAEPESKPEPETMAKEAVEEEEAHDIIDLDYAELYNNPESYMDKYVRISGEIASLGKNVAGVKFLTFRDGTITNITNYIYINLKESQSLEGLSKGDYVTVVGKVSGKVLGSVDVDNSIIESKGESVKKIADEQFDKRTTSITAIELTNAYEENEINADNLYKDKLLKISGTVDDIGKDITGKVYFTFDNGDPYKIASVQCYFARLDEEQINKVAELRKGDSVVVIGTCSGKGIFVAVRDCKIQ